MKSEQKTSYIEVTKTYLQSSSIRGFPRIIKAQNVFSKLIWTVTIMTFLSIAVWQVSDIVLGYLKYGVQMEYSSTMDPGAPFPSVTLCNQQPFAAEAAAEGFVANRSFGDFVSKVISLETALGLPMDSMKTVSVFYQNSQVLQIDAIAHDSLRLIKDCKVEFELDGLLQTRGCADTSVQKFPHPRYLRCFTVRLAQPNPNLPPGARVRSLRLVLFLDNFNYPFYYRDLMDNDPDATRQGVRVSVHPSGSLPQLDVNYIDVPPGASATLRVSTVKRSLLPKPYGDCKPEAVAPIRASSPLTDALSYAYTPSACVKICLQQSLIDRCGCLDPSLPMPQGAVVDDGAIDLPLSVARRDPGGPPGGFVYTETVLPGGGVEIKKTALPVGRNSDAGGATAAGATTTAATTGEPYPGSPDGPMVPYCRKWPPKAENATVANRIYQEKVACWQRQRAKQSAIKYCMLGARNLTCDQPCNATEHSVTTSYAGWPREAFHLAVYEKYISYDDSRKKYFEDIAGVLGMVSDARYAEAYAAVTTSRKIKDNFVEVVVVKPTWNVTEIAETPAFPLSRLLSSIGGAMNLWSGITIIALLEFMELLAILAGTCFENNCRQLGPAAPPGEGPAARGSDSLANTGPPGGGGSGGGGSPVGKEGEAKAPDTYGSLFTWS